MFYILFPKPIHHIKFLNFNYSFSNIKCITNKYIINTEFVKIVMKFVYNFFINLIYSFNQIYISIKRYVYMVIFVYKKMNTFS